MAKMFHSTLFSYLLLSSIVASKRYYHGSEFSCFFFSRVRIFGFASLAQMRDIANFGRNENTMRLYIKTRINSNEKVIFAFAFDNNVCGFTKAYNDLEHGAQTNDTHTQQQNWNRMRKKKFGRGKENKKRKKQLLSIIMEHFS